MLTGSFSLPVSGETLNLEPTLEKNFTITLLNYNEDLIDTRMIIASLPDYFTYDTYTFTLNYEIVFASSEFEADFNNYVDAISTTDTWTSRLNTTALNEQKNNFERKDIFERQNGTSVDATKLEKYLDDKSVENGKLSYNIYLLNLTRLDTEDTKHWFNVTEVDPDSGRQRFYWRLEWDYSMNYDVRFPYAAYSSVTDTSFIDLTSFQWYLTWRAIWNKDVVSDDSYFLQIQDMIKGKLDSEVRSIISDTMIIWLADLIIYSYNMYNIPTDIKTDVNTNIVIVYNSTQKSAEELSWIVNPSVIKEQMGIVLQTQRVGVKIDFVDLNEDNTMLDFVNEAKVDYSELQPSSTAFSNWTYYDGGRLHWGISEFANIKNKYFDNPDNGTTLSGLILLLENSSFVGYENWIPWTGGMYTGLGGNSKTAILYELDRAFMPDGGRKSGLSKVLIHELGHAIGMPHPFYNRFSADFSNKVMGYYPGTEKFSEISLQSYWSELVLMKLELLYNNTRDDYSSENIEIYKSKFDDVMKAFDDKLFLKSYELLIELMDIIDPSINNSASNKNDFRSLYMIFAIPIVLLKRRRYKQN